MNELVNLHVFTKDYFVLVALVLFTNCQIFSTKSFRFVTEESTTTKGTIKTIETIHAIQNFNL